MKINLICESETFTPEICKTIFPDSTIEKNLDSYSDYDLNLIDISLLETFKDKFDELAKESKKIIFISTSNEYNIKYAFEILSKDRPPYHIVGINDENDHQNLKKISDCIQNGEVVTFDEWQEKAINIAELKVKDSANISDVIRDTLEKFEFENCFSAIKDSLSQLINELLYNALFNAPTDKDGKQLFKEQDRKIDVNLDEENSAILKITNSESQICISVVDKYGSITKEVIDAHISKSEVSDKKGGAGIGLSLIYNNSHELIFVVEPGVKTEVISVINKYKRYKKNMKHVRSFHFFIKGNN